MFTLSNITAIDHRRACPVAAFRGTLGLLLLVALLCLMLGCQSASHAQHKPGEVPPDLSIELFIQGDPLSPDPLTHRSRYLLEADRSLHIALNAQTQRQTYPPFVRFLTHAQMMHVANLIDEHKLMQAASIKTDDADSDNKEPVTYTLNLMAWSKTRRISTTLEATPGVRVLLEYLIEVGKVQPTGQTLPKPTVLPFHSPVSVESP